MRALAILIAIILPLISVIAQSDETIELEKEVVYERNPLPDILLPDYFLKPAYPELPADRYPKEPVRLALTEKALQEKTVRNVIPPDLLGFPRVPRQRVKDKAGVIQLRSSCLDGFILSGEFWPRGGRSSLFFTSSGEWDILQQSYGWIGYRWSRRGELSLSGGGHLDESPLWMILGEGEWENTGISLEYWSLDSQQKTRLRLDRKFLMEKPVWSPYFGIAGAGILDDSYDYSLRPYLGISGRGVNGQNMIWRSNAEILTEYDSRKAKFDIFGQAQFFLQPSESFTGSLFLDFKEYEPSELRNLGLVTGILPGGTPGKIQDGGAHFTIQRTFWDGSVRSGCMWGDFIRYEQNIIFTEQDAVPYIKIEITQKKKGSAVADYAFSAEYLNRDKWEFYFLNSWYFAEQKWQGTVKAGYFSPGNVSSPIIQGDEPFRCEVSAEYKHGNLWRFGMFTGYLPGESELDGGLSFRITY